MRVGFLGQEDPLEKEMALKMAPTPVFSPGKFHGQSSLVAYGPCGCKESDTEVTEHASASTRIKSGAAAAADLQHPLKGIQGGEQE